MAKLDGKLLALLRARLTAAVDAFSLVRGLGFYVDGISTLRDADGTTEITLRVRERGNEEDKEP